MSRVLVFPEGLDHFPMFNTKSTAHIDANTFLLKAEVQSSFGFRGFVGYSIMAKD